MEIYMPSSLAGPLMSASLLMDKPSLLLNTVWDGSSTSLGQMRVLAVVFACGVCMGMLLMAMFWIGCCCSGYSAPLLPASKSKKPIAMCNMITAAKMRADELEGFTSELLEQLCVLKGLQLNKQHCKISMITELSQENIATAAQLRYIKNLSKQCNVQPEASNLLTTLAAGKCIDKLKSLL